MKLSKFLSKISYDTPVNLFRRYSRGGEEYLGRWVWNGSGVMNRDIAEKHKDFRVTYVNSTVLQDGRPCIQVYLKKPKDGSYCKNAQEAWDRAFMYEPGVDNEMSKETVNSLIPTGKPVGLLDNPE